MRIFYGFLILFTAVMLWFVPVTEVTYTFRTDVAEDSFYISTAVGETSDNITLQDELYGDDTSTIDILSDLNTDVISVVSYNSTSRATWITGLTDNATRTLEVSYDTQAVSDTWDNLLDDFVPPMWIILIIIWPLAALAALFTGRAGA